MRLNFAGVREDEIREGIRRIGRAMGGQAGLLGALTGSMGSARAGSSAADAPAAVAAVSPSPGSGSEPPGDAGLADVLELPRRDPDARSQRRKDR
jgi:2-aminoadipate transaminase